MRTLDRSTPQTFVAAGHPGEEEPSAHLRGQCFRDALRIADAFVGRFGDGLTKSLHDDVCQISGVAAAWRWADVRDKARFPAYVRSIARHCRARAIRDALRLPTQSIDAEPELLECVVPREQVEPSYRVCGTWVPRGELLEVLPQIIGRLTALNRQLLLGFYEGFTCLELAERFGVPPDNIKVRLYRARRRIRRLWEARVRRTQRLPGTGPSRGDATTLTTE
ncbi:MAG: sigma-70 family RNA polymerase sigma factor [Planctomycetes bacterium]|nr:sigma-70 family RNA polymerase sigma factor [Planctomycetota bacterium]